MVGRCVLSTAGGCRTGAGRRRDSLRAGGPRAAIGCWNEVCGRKSPISLTETY